MRKPLLLETARTFEPDFVLICKALLLIGYQTANEIADIMSIDLSHAETLIKEVKDEQITTKPGSFRAIHFEQGDTSSGEDTFGAWLQRNVD